MLKNALTLILHPKMGFRYCVWLWFRFTGQVCRLNLSAGGTITGFRRFSNYWAADVPTPGELNVLRRAIRPGDVVADVGANLGAFTVSMALLAPQAEILSFEPSPSTFRQLRANVERNGLTNVEVIQAAISDSSGQQSFIDDGQCSARNRLVANGAPTPSESVVSVAAHSLDQFCAERKIERLALVKSDTEGAESRVFRGATELLREKRIDLMLVEICPAALVDMGSTVQEYVSTVESRGYGVFRVRPDGTAGDRLSAEDLGRITLGNVLIQPV